MARINKLKTTSTECDSRAGDLVLYIQPRVCTDGTSIGDVPERAHLICNAEQVLKMVGDELIIVHLMIGNNCILITICL